MTLISKLCIYNLIDRKNVENVDPCITWDQAQFERFSYILSNGYRWNWGSLFVSPCPPECYLQSEMKIEPDLRLIHAVKVYPYL